MLWDVRNKWPSGAQFTFKFYRHWATLVVRDTGDGSGHFLHKKEGVTQGDPLSHRGPSPYKGASGITPPGNTGVVRG